MESFEHLHMKVDIMLLKWVRIVCGIVFVVWDIREYMNQVSDETYTIVSY